MDKAQARREAHGIIAAHIRVSLETEGFEGDLVGIADADQDRICEELRDLADQHARKHAPLPRRQTI